MLESLLTTAGDPACGRRALWLVALRAGANRAVGRALAANPGCPSSLMRCLAWWGRWDVACAVAANARCPARLRRYLARSFHWAVRASVAANPLTEARVLRNLSRSILTPELVRMALVTNPALETGIVDQLLAHKSLFVRGAAAAHPAASAAALTNLAEGFSEPAWVLRAIGANPACPAELSDQLLTWIALGGAANSDPNFDPVTCRGHPADTRFTAMSWYSEQGRDARAYLHPLWRVRAVMSGENGRIPFAQVRMLSRDANAEVRRLVTRMNGVPINAMMELAGDADPRIAERAAARVKASPAAVRRWRFRMGVRLGPVPFVLTAFIVGALTDHNPPTQSSPFLPVQTVSPSPVRIPVQRHHSGPISQRCGGVAGGYTFLGGLPGGGSLQCETGIGGHTHFLDVTAGSLALTVTLPSGVALLEGAPVVAPLRLQPGLTAGLTLTTRMSSVRITIATTQGVTSVVKLILPAASR